MAYTIVKSDGTVLTTIADGTINTTSTSLGLPGRNYAGYGQTVDTNFVHQVENFAATTPPSNPLRGQLWYNTNNSTLYVCPTDGEANALAWLSLTSTSGGGATTFGSVTVTGNLVSNNITATNNSNANAATFSYLTVTANANIATANVTSATIGTFTTTLITTGSSVTTGAITGTWTLNGTGTANAVAGTGLYVNSGNIVINNSGNTIGIRTDLYMYANGVPISFSGTYANSNVAAYLPTYNGNILAANIQTPIITTGANTTAGTVTGNWTLTTGSRLNATYADLAERHRTDMIYPIGTIVKVGGEFEITKTTEGDLTNVIGVVSNTAAYLMNSEAGNDETHPAITIAGRVVVRVLGSINKGNKLTTGANGCAIASNSNGFGWALESSNEVNEKLILSVIK